MKRRINSEMDKEDDRIPYLSIRDLRKRIADAPNGSVIPVTEPELRTLTRRSRSPIGWVLRVAENILNLFLKALYRLQLKTLSRIGKSHGNGNLTDQPPGQTKING